MFCVDSINKNISKELWETEQKGHSSGTEYQRLYRGAFICTSNRLISKRCRFAAVSSTMPHLLSDEGMNAEEISSTSWSTVYTSYHNGGRMACNRWASSLSPK